MFSTLHNYCSHSRGAKKSVSFVTRNYKTASRKPKLKLDLDFYCTATDLFLLKHVLQKIFCQK